MKQHFKGGTIRFLLADDLRIHPKAQRAFDEKHAKALAASFDPDAFGALTVVEQNGKMFVVDGQHRLWAAKHALGAGQMVPCRVLLVENDEGAARLFLGANKTKAPKTMDKFMALLVARDPAAVAIHGILKSHDLAVARTRGEGAVQAIAALDSVFKRPRGDAILSRVIGILRSAWGRNPDAYASALILGLGLVIAQYGDAVDDGVLASKLAKDGTPARFVGKARDLAKVKGVSVQHGSAEKIVAVYNKGCRTGGIAAA